MEPSEEHIKAANAAIEKARSSSLSKNEKFNTFSWVIAKTAIKKASETSQYQRLSGE